MLHDYVYFYILGVNSVDIGTETNVITEHSRDDHSATGWFGLYMMWYIFALIYLSGVYAAFMFFDVVLCGIAVDHCGS